MTTPPSDITRFHVTRRHSRTVVHDEVAYLAGITASDRAADVAQQTRDVFQTIDHLLAEQGAQRTDLLSAQVWLKNVAADFTTFNDQWEAWMPEGHAPARAVVEANMAAPDILVEVMVMAALPKSRT